MSGSISANISVHQRSCLHARRSYKRSPRPLLPQPKPWGRRGAKRFLSCSISANISVHQRSCLHARRSYKRSPRSLAPPAKALGAKGGQAVLGLSSLANIRVCERLGCWMRLLLSKKTGGLIASTCGLGGPHYGKNKQPNMLGGTFRGRRVVGALNA